MDDGGGGDVGEGQETIQRERCPFVCAPRVEGFRLCAGLSRERERVSESDGTKVMGAGAVLVTSNL